MACTVGFLLICFFEVERMFVLTQNLSTNTHWLSSALTEICLCDGFPLVMVEIKTESKGFTTCVCV